MTGRNLLRASLTLAGAAALGAAALAAPAQADTTTATGTTAACVLSAGSITAAGAHTLNSVGGTPPVKGQARTTNGVFQPGQARLTTGYISEPNIAGSDISGWMIQNDSLFQHIYAIDGVGDLDPSGPNSFVRIGGGWTKFVALETSVYETTSSQRHTAYGLRNDGTLFRWNNPGAVWRPTGSATGFASVKSLALIGKTAGYDTFLANTRSGSLYSIKIPAASPMKPIVTRIRATGWQGFEKLIAGKCGVSGTLLLGIDKDSKAGFTYAISHANGPATVIQNLGKVKGAFADPINFRWGPVSDLDPLTGG